MYNRATIILSADFLAETAGQKGVAQYIQSDERKKLTTKTTKNALPTKVSFRFEGEIILETNKR